MKLQTLVFGDRLYRVDEPEPSWHQPSPNDAAECGICGGTLTFCFAGRTDESKAGIGTYYMFPVGVRCDCFLDSPQPEKMPYHRTLKRQPVPITLIESEKLAK
jgi:hypothetical protein